MKRITYIHFGSNYYSAARFRPVQNAGLFTKPAKGTGLWASRVDAQHGWEHWCRENDFQIDHLQHAFRFELVGASVLTLSDPMQLCSLPKLRPWRPKDSQGLETLEVGEVLSLEQLHALYAPNWCLLDFERLAERYDAIELVNSEQFRDSLATWDCDCLLVMRNEKVRVVNQD